MEMDFEKNGNYNTVPVTNTKGNASPPTGRRLSASKEEEYKEIVSSNSQIRNANTIKSVVTKPIKLALFAGKNDLRNKKDRSVHREEINKLISAYNKSIDSGGTVESNADLLWSIKTKCLVWLESTKLKDSSKNPIEFLRGKFKNKDPKIQSIESAIKEIDEIMSNLTLDSILAAYKNPNTKEGYEEDRNYLSYGPDPEPTGWKIHVGAADGERLNIALLVSFLRKKGIPHKFDLTEDNDKFLTIYPAKGEDGPSSLYWSNIIKQLESVLVRIKGRVIANEHQVASNLNSNSSVVYMRHGLNTPIYYDKVKGFVEEDGKLGRFIKLKGGIYSVDKDFILLTAGKELFFTIDGTAPKGLSTETVYMAIIVNNKIVPDKREQPNPGKAPVPANVHILNS